MAFQKIHVYMIHTEVGGGVWCPLYCLAVKLDPGGVLTTHGSHRTGVSTLEALNIDQSSFSSNSSWFQLISG